MTDVHSYHAVKGFERVCAKLGDKPLYLSLLKPGQNPGDFPESLHIGTCQAFGWGTLWIGDEPLQRHFYLLAQLGVDKSVVDEFNEQAKRSGSAVLSNGLIDSRSVAETPQIAWCIAVFSTLFGTSWVYSIDGRDVPLARAFTASVATWGRILKSESVQDAKPVPGANDDTMGNVDPKDCAREFIGRCLEFAQWLQRGDEPDYSLRPAEETQREAHNKVLRIFRDLVKNAVACAPLIASPPEGWRDVAQAARKLAEFVASWERKILHDGTGVAWQSLLDEWPTLNTLANAGREALADLEHARDAGKWDFLRAGQREEDYIGRLLDGPVDVELPAREIVQLESHLKHEKVNLRLIQRERRSSPTGPTGESESCTRRSKLEKILAFNRIRQGQQQANEEATPSQQVSKRSTEPGEGQAKLIAALTQHHHYADDGCLNLEPVGVNELARLASVSQSTASTFFNASFSGGKKGGHAKYKAICRDAGRLAISIRALRGEISPHYLFGRSPPDEGSIDDE